MAKDSTLLKIVVLAAVLVGAVNMVTLREYWILAASMGILIPVTIYYVRKRKTFQTDKFDHTYIIQIGISKVHGRNRGVF